MRRGLEQNGRHVGDLPVLQIKREDPDRATRFTDLADRVLRSLAVCVATGEPPGDLRLRQRPYAVCQLIDGWPLRLVIVRRSPRRAPDGRGDRHAGERERESTESA